MTTRMSKELLTDLADQIVRAMTEMIDEDDARAKQVAQEVVNRMIENWAGSMVYFPFGLALIISMRDEEIFKEFTGNNHIALAKKHRLSLQWVYTIIKRQRKKAFDARQPRLL